MPDTVVVTVNRPTVAVTVPPPPVFTIAAGIPGPPGPPGTPGTSYDPAAADLRYVNLTGDTMTGQLTLTEPLWLTGTTLSTRLIYWPSVDALLATKDDGSFALSNGSVTIYRPITVGAPTASEHAATKQYVDGKTVTLPPETDAKYNTGYGIGTHNGGPAITGQYNNAVGWNAQLQLTTGLNNNAMGAQTQFSLTTGSDNCAVGSSAQYSVKGGTGNTAVGSSSQWGLTTGTDNVGIGFQSAYNVTTGFDNVAIGWRAQFTLATAWRNTAVGHAAQRGLTTGNYNTAMGEGAQYEPKNLSANATTTATGQTAIGPYTGQYAAGTGNYGTAVGYGAVYHTGATAIGYNTEARGVDSTAIGKGAIATLDNQITLGRSTERVYAPGALNLPQAAPATPVNGDVWVTSAGLFVRVNGVTVGPLT